jgi:hypothetical protein
VRTLVCLIDRRPPNSQLAVGYLTWPNSCMPTPALNQVIQSRIQTFLAELSGLVRRSAMEAVQAALSTDSATPARRGPGRPRDSTLAKRGPGRPRKGGRLASGGRLRRSAEDLQAIGGRVLSYVRSNAGARLEEIGRGLKTDTAILKRPVALLLEGKQLRTEGQKRGTKYFAGGTRGGAARKAKPAKERKPAKRAGRKAMRGRRASSNRAMRKAAKAKPAATPTAAAA